jgi:hypothetical protein
MSGNTRLNFQAMSIRHEFHDDFHYILRSVDLQELLAMKICFGIKSAIVEERRIFAYNLSAF